MWCDKGTVRFHGTWLLRRVICFSGLQGTGNAEPRETLQVGIHPSAAEEFVTMRSVSKRLNKQGEVVKS